MHIVLVYRTSPRLVCHLLPVCKPRQRCTPSEIVVNCSLLTSISDRHHHLKVPVTSRPTAPSASGVFLGTEPVQCRWRFSLAATAVRPAQYFSHRSFHLGLPLITIRKTVPAQRRTVPLNRSWH
ncbi:hypothetical protein KCP70_05605 [Salmonella enterica subsp. enterica]|nr:hypothetical protein KCP70_05605 [Salmonella enterica subsp. enterica]